MHHGARLIAAGVVDYDDFQPLILVCRTKGTQRNIGPGRGRSVLDRLQTGAQQILNIPTNNDDGEIADGHRRGGAVRDMMIGVKSGSIGALDDEIAQAYHGFFVDIIGQIVQRVARFLEKGGRFRLGIVNGIAGPHCGHHLLHCGEP